MHDAMKNAQVKAQAERIAALRQELAESVRGVHGVSFRPLASA